MIIHNTTYSVLPETEESWTAWVRDVHIPKIATLPGVSTCQFMKLLTEIESDGVTYTIQVQIDSLANAETYLSEHDPALQSGMMDQFSGQMVYFQTLLRMM